MQNLHIFQDGVMRLANVLEANREGRIDYYPTIEEANQIHAGIVPNTMTAGEVMEVWPHKQLRSV